jgi:hypothetical protein
VTADRPVGTGIELILPTELTVGEVPVIVTVGRAANAGCKRYVVEELRTRNILKIHARVNLVNIISHSF